MQLRFTTYVVITIKITAPPLDCAQSGYLHTICSVVTKKTISSQQLRLRLTVQQRRTFADVYSFSENSHLDKSVRQQTTQSSSRSSKYQLSQNTCINVSCRSQHLAKLFLSCMRGHIATPAPVSPASSWTHLLTRHRTRLHDPRTPATTSQTLAQTCNRLSTSAPVVQLSRQMQESATSVRPHVHAG